MATRATKSGIALDAQKKVDSKWDPERCKIALCWVGERTGNNLSSDGSMDDCYNKLSNGEILCQLANWVKPGAIPKSKLGKKSEMPFKKMELIGLFLASIDEANGGPVKKTDLFQTIDLFERDNLVQVVMCLEALGRSLLTAGREGFGKAESKGEHHNWTEEQLNAGKGIIGLQMGSNKGATQAGQNFGQTRHITPS